MELFETFFPFETSRLRMREITNGDRHALFRIYSDNEVMKYYKERFSSPDQVTDLITRYREGLHEKSHHRWAICLKDRSELIGTCGLYNFDLIHSFCSLGYELNRSHWRKGYMLEALKKVIEYGFEKLKLHRIECQIHVDNIASIRLAEKLGFKTEGLLKENFFLRGKYYDSYIYGIVKTGSIVQ